MSTSFAKYADSPCLGRRLLKDKTWGPYTWKTYREVRTTFENLGSGIRSLGLPPEKNRIGIYSSNRPEWAYTYLAALSQGFVSVPLYDTLAPNAITYVINHAELEIVASSNENLPKLLGAAPSCQSLKFIITWNPPAESDHDKAKQLGIRLFSLEDLLKQGSEHPVAPSPSGPDDMILLMYTSGTTGVPKGVMLRNSNFLATLASTSYSSYDLTPKDVHISYLPLAHIFEMLCLTGCLYFGSSVGFWRGDLLGLLEDMQALSPTVLVGVPRVYNRIHDKIRSQVQQSTTSRTLFTYAFNSKLAHYQATGEEKSPLWDRFVFSKLTALLGGRVRLIVSGSAPLSPEVQNFLRICFCCKVVQGYGLTESTALTTVSDVDDINVGHVGAPAVCVEIKLVDAPELNYYSSSRGKQQGEVCLRGASIFPGYFKMPKETADVIDRDGWFHTGDIGEWLPNGTLKIIDRKKNIFKLAQGEYVAAEYLDTVYSRCPFVQQSFIYGDSFKNYLVGIVVPNPEVLLPWAKQQGIKGDLPELCKNDTVRKAVFQGLIKEADKAKLKGFEKLKNVYLEPEVWTVDAGFLTPSLKTVRGALGKKYQAVIHNLYEEPRLDGHVSKPKL
uniref:Long-chain-fatty-acid--CoA ligase n=1 Tax=Arcella intermedia TaxID=1963864 RepID=A0A6B2KZY9_9EUKA